MILDCRSMTSTGRHIVYNKKNQGSRFYLNIAVDNLFEGLKDYLIVLL